MLKPLDEATADLVIASLRRARVTCQSPAHVLHRTGLLLTADLAAQIRSETLTSAAEAVRNTRMKNLIEAKLMPKDPSPLQVSKAIADRLDWLAELAGRGEFR